MLPCHNDNGGNVRIWPGDRLGDFTVASAYRLLHDFHELEVSSLWKNVWKLNVAEHVRNFIGQTMHGCLLTNQWRHCSRFGLPSVSFSAL